MDGPEILLAILNSVLSLATLAVAFWAAKTAFKAYDSQREQISMLRQEHEYLMADFQRIDRSRQPLLAVVKDRNRNDSANFELNDGSQLRHSQILNYNISDTCHYLRVNSDAEEVDCYLLIRNLNVGAEIIDSQIVSGDSDVKVSLHGPDKTGRFLVHYRCTKSDATKGYPIEIRIQVATAQGTVSTQKYLTTPVTLQFKRIDPVDHFE